MLIDTHCHLDDSKYDADREEIIARAKDAGVQILITIGTGLKDSRWAVDFSKDREDVWPTVGMHPSMVAEYDHNRDLPLFTKLASKKSVVAIGEVGIDYYHAQDQKAEQEALLRDMVRLSLEKKLPLVIHQRNAAKDESRQAEADTLKILTQEGAGVYGGVFHCFAGSAATAASAIKMGFMIAVGGVLTFKNAQDLRDVIREVPLDKLVLETDAPWLAPQAMRGKRNEPAYLGEVVKQVAVLKNMSEEEAAKKTSANARRLYRLDCLMEKQND